MELNTDTEKCALFIDDDKATNFINQHLAINSNLFNKVITANGAEEALIYLKKANEGDNILPSIIFLDINMPAMVGWDFLNEYENLIFLENKKIKIYMLSSSSRKEDIKKANFNKNISGFITKPITKQNLNQLLF